jgi:Undecaprenyl-phosphate glucose phosphotransferase
MTAALARARHAQPEPQDPKPEAQPLDVAGLQALAKDAMRVIEPEAAPDALIDARDRRGPFRPEQLISSRARRSGAVAVRLFRGADAAALMALTLAVAQATIGGELLAAPVRAVLPLVVAALLTAGLLRGLHLYRFGRNELLNVHLIKLTAVFAAGCALCLGLCALIGSGPKVMLGVGIWFALALMSLHTLHVWWWSTVRGWRTSGKLTPNVVVVGATKHAERLIKAALARRDVNVIGVFDDRLARSPDALAGVPILGDIQSLLEHRITPFVDRVVIAVDPSARLRVRQIAERLRVLPNEVSLLVDLETADEREAALSRLADAPLTRVSGLPEDERRALSKRVQDVVVGSLAAVLLAPVMAVIAVIVRLDSSGPAFFRQKRHGFNNETITVWKFRSMRQDKGDATGARQVTADDDRITKVGRFLRNTSLDELPQLINVLKGEMSLVGPRPHPVAMKTGDTESARLVAEYAWRHRMKPGMTGWAAIKGSRGPLHTPAEVRRRVALDIEYIERQSLWLDLYCMAMTIPCLLGDKLAVR